MMRFVGDMTREELLEELGRLPDATDSTTSRARLGQVLGLPTRSTRKRYGSY
jgi:hypothetical protein